MRLVAKSRGWEGGLAPALSPRSSFDPFASSQLQAPAFRYIIGLKNSHLASVNMEENQIPLRLTFVRTIRRTGWSSAR
jgi:hypothetical protein